MRYRSTSASASIASAIVRASGRFLIELLLDGKHR
jgi:hypothetical protein